jgi:hypothetical protein
MFFCTSTTATRAELLADQIRDGEQKKGYDVEKERKNAQKWPIDRLTRH